jgi:hypothetical protein
MGVAILSENVRVEFKALTSGDERGKIEVGVIERGARF